MSVKKGEQKSTPEATKEFAPQKPKLSERDKDILSRHVAKAKKCLAAKAPIPAYVTTVIEGYGEKVPNA